MSSKDFNVDMEMEEPRSNSVSSLINDLNNGTYRKFFGSFLNLLASFQEEESGDQEPAGYGEALEAALAERDLRKDSKKAHMDFSNPAFSTTDV